MVQTKVAQTTGVYFFGECWWSRAFLAGIDDPEWPPWTPVKKAGYNG